MDSIIAKFAEERETLSALKDHGEVEKDQLHNEMAELENDLAEASEHLQTAIREAAMWEDKCKLQSQEMNTLRTKHASDLAREEAEKQELRAQISNLRDNSKLGTAQRQAEEADQRVQELSVQLNATQNEVKRLMAERKDLEMRLSAAEDHVDEAVADRIASERSRAKALETALQSMKDAQVEESKHWESTQHERDELVKENDELKNWKAVYEAGHGLQQLARNQKKLTDDNRRLTQALEQRTTQYSALMDTHNALSLAFERLQKETGRTVPLDLNSPDLADEVKNTASGLQLQIRELEDQVNMLEEDNSRLRKQLRTQVGTMTEGGIKYPGLTPEQLMKVNEFAANLRNGSLELPLDDRSRQLLAENKQLKKDLAAMNAALLKHERDTTDAAGAAGFDASVDGGFLSDAFGTDIKTLLKENEVMQQALNEINARLENSASSVMQHQSADFVPGSSRKGGDRVVAGSSSEGFGPAELARILSHNNDMILKELESLRRAQQQMQSSHHQHHHPAAEQHQLATTVGRPPLSQSMSRAALVSTAHTPMHPARPSSQATGQAESSPFPWTPFSAGRSGHVGHRPNQFYTPQTPAASSSAGHAYMGPQTPFGKTLLADAVQPLQLPPEEWAAEVKDLYAQLVQCLEQLFERDIELEQTRGFVKTYESQLGDMKLQMTILYHDFAQRSRQWNEQQRSNQEEKKTLHDEIDDLRLKVRRLQEMNLLYQREDPDAIQNKLSEVTRRAMILEVNEAILSRKYISATESLAVEQKRRTEIHSDFVEMEGALKERILFLEHFKETATMQLTRLQAKLDNTVPADDFQSALTELASLREDHLHALRRQAEHQSASLAALDAAREVRSLRLVLAEAKHETERLRASNHALQTQLGAQKDATTRIATAAQSSAEVAALVSELATCKGEASRLDFELLAQHRRVESLTDSLTEVLTETEALSKRVAELTAREEQFTAQESAARHALVALQLRYERGGLTRDEAQAMQARLEAAEEARRRAEDEATKQRALAEIASAQATQARHVQTSFEAEVRELREYAARLESRGDDDVLIGRLQRELLATKASYRAFARKYQVAREGMRRREIALRRTEGALLGETHARQHDVGRYQQSLSALAAAMETLKSSVLQIDFLPSLASSSSSTAAIPTKEHHQSQSQPPKQSQQSQPPQHLGQSYKRTSYVTFPVGAKVAEVSTKLDQLAVQAQEAVARATEKDHEARRWQHDCEALSVEKAALLRRLQDLDAVLIAPSSTSSSSSSTSRHQSHQPQQQQQAAIAARIIALSEENRVAKVAQLTARRQIAQLRDEMKHLRGTIATLEGEVVALERAKVEADAQLLRQQHHHQHHQTEKTTTSFLHPLFDNDVDGDGDGHDGDHFLDPLAIIPFFTSAASTSASASATTTATATATEKAESVRLSIDTDHLQESDTDAHIEDAHHPRRRIDPLRDELHRSAAALAAREEDCAEALRLVEEKDAQLAYYEKLLREQGMAGLLLRPGGVTTSTSTTPLTDRQRPNSNSLRHSRDAGASSLSAVEQQQMQAAATATISSLKQLLEEKNRTIENYREKVERMLAEGFGSGSGGRGHKSRATQRADDLLDALDDRQHPSSSSSSSSSSKTAAAATATFVDEAQQQRRLQSQLEDAEAILADKDGTIAQLEQKLASQSNQRERAELRCAEGIEEMEAMKLDMVTLLRQLQESEARCAALQRTGRVEIVSRPPVATEAGTGTGSNVIPGQAPPSEESRTQLLELQKKHQQLVKKVKECEKLLRGKEDKIRGYRDIIVRLKEEFIKTEEAHAVHEVTLKTQGQNSNINGNNGGGVSSEELRGMRDKVAALSDGLKATKADLEAAKRARDKLHKERQEAQDLLEKAEDRCRKAEQQSTHAQNIAARYRKELEEARKKEVRLREKLKDVTMSGGGGATGSGIGTGTVTGMGTGGATAAFGGLGHTKKDAMQKLREKDEVQQRELELLRAQLALYQQVEHKHHAQSKDGGGGSGGEAKHGPAHSNQALAASLSLAPGKNAHVADDGDHENRDAAGARRGGQPQQQQRSASGGYILGVGEGMLETDAGGARGALAARWEAEKTLRQRVQALEKKLQEAAQENNELRDTVTRFNLQQQQQQQLHQQRGHHGGSSSSSSPTRGGGSHKISSAADNPNKATTTHQRPAHELLELDAARRRVFELESDLSAARRRADVELTAQLRQLQQQLASATHQLRAAETQLAQHEERRKKEQQYGNSANNPLRASEDRFLREERLHDELDFARRQRLELEAQLLERDAQTLELRFESEEKAAERLRLQRRVKEQEDVIRQLREAAGHLAGAGDLPFSRIVGAGPGPGAGASGTGTGGSRRENELESVVESMKRVIEKLRADNERLRRGISGPLAGGTSNLGGGQSHHQTTQQQPTSQNAPTSGTGTDWEKRFGAEKKRNEKLTEELNLLRAKQAEKEDSQTKLSQKTQQLSTLQKKLAKRDEEVQRQVGDITRLVAEKETLTRQLQQLQQQQQQLVQQQQQQPKQKHGAAGLSVSEEEEVLRQMTGTQAENDSLRLEVSDLRKKLASLSGSNSNSNRAGGGGDIDRLKEENAKLKAELAAFDLDFFEEIENLKFAHAEAMRKLKTFEQRFGPLR